MVFGWGKKKQNEKPVDEIPLNKEIRLSDVHKVVTDLNQLRQSQALSEIKHLRDDTEPLIAHLIKIGNVLESDNLKVDDIDKHLAIIVVRGKKQVIDVIKKDVTPLLQVFSMNDAIKLNVSLGQILKKTGDVLGRQTRVIHIFAKKYASQLKENLEIMNSNHAEIGNILKNFERAKSTSDEIIDTLNQINILKETRVEKSHKIIDTNQNVQSLEKKITSIQNSIDSIHSSDDYKKYLNLKNTLDAFATKKLKIKNEIDAQFTKISRPLGRYEYASSLDKDQKNILSVLVENPFDVLLPPNKDSIIVILENVRKGITSGSISVKDIDKTLSQITETEELLDKFVKQVSEYLENRGKIQSDLNSLKSENLISLETEFAKNTSFKNDSLLKSQTIQDEISEIDSKIPQLTSEIEKKLRLFSSTRYTVLSS